jgi:hypothetical protein
VAFKKVKQVHEVEQPSISGEDRMGSMSDRAGAAERPGGTMCAKERRGSDRVEKAGKGRKRHTDKRRTVSGGIKGTWAKGAWCLGESSPFLCIVFHNNVPAGLWLVMWTVHFLAEGAMFSDMSSSVMGSMSW